MQCANSLFCSDVNETCVNVELRSKNITTARFFFDFDSIQRGVRGWGDGVMEEGGGGGKTQRRLKKITNESYHLVTSCATVSQCLLMATCNGIQQRTFTTQASQWVSQPTPQNQTLHNKEQAMQECSEVHKKLMQDK